MSKINSLLAQRLKSATQKLSKMAGLTERSSFAGVFRITPLSSKERENLELLLKEYKHNDLHIEDDLDSLSNITSEVKAISNQAAILHGERIQNAQTILKKYRDGAFSAWLFITYGNRQTPYNFLQYYELYQQLPSHLHPQLDAMPRQAVYTLASRNAPLKEKEKIIRDYNGAPKTEILSLIRKSFPLAHTDKRAEDIAEQAITNLKKAIALIEQKHFHPSPKQKETLRSLATRFSNIDIYRT